MATESLPQLLSDEQLASVLEIAGEADSVEMKLTVPESDQRATVTALGLDPLDAEIRQVFFFDTPDLLLNQHGLVVRARRVQRKGDDSVVKLRPVVPDDLPAEMRDSPSMVVEVDAMPGGYVCSATLKGTLGTTHVRRAAQGKLPQRKLFSKEQRKFFAAHAPEGIELDDLTLLGPIFVLKLRFRPEEYKRKFVAELWLYPDGTRILELSTKCAPADAFRVAQESKAYLLSQGVDLSGEQQTKTKTALDYFSKNLAAAESA